MKAIVQGRYGAADALELRDIDRPIVKDDEVLVRVHAAGINPYDWHWMTGLPYVARPVFGLRKPKRRLRGWDVAGRVEAVGTSLTQLQVGDEVFGWSDGAFAEYVCAEARQFVQKPANVTLEQAAAVPMGALTALQALRDHGNVQPGQRVLVNGASGGVGTFAVQIAKSLGAEVTGVCSTRNVDLVRSIGADHVIDYTREDFTRTGERYDVILDNVGNRSLSGYRRALTAKGMLVPNSGLGGRWIGPVGRLLKARVRSMFVSQRVATFTAEGNRDDLLALKELIEAGKVTPVIDRTYPLAETADAFRYLEKGHTRGKVVITV
jgi:NADPH:quinone reductase-like Zn-dependent oxidoreductase